MIDPISETQTSPVETDHAEPTKHLKNIGYYTQILAKDLSPEVFTPYPLRLIWYALCGAGTLGSIFLIAWLSPSWPVKLALGLLIGFCNGTLAFISHELFHGSIVKSQRVQSIIGFFSAIPFFISPTFWRYWHNRLHHGRTQQLIRDPDAFPNLKVYKASSFMKFMFPFTPGSGHKRSITYFFFWFSFHNFVAQTYLRYRNKIFDALDQRRVTLEFGAQIAVALAIAIWVGPKNWLWVFVIPLFVQNYILMSYIATNHNLSPLTPVNDPLVNSLSVSNNSILEYLSLNFGYHVEHHIYPNVSGAKIKAVHHALVKNFPNEYKIMSKWSAMRDLYKTPRIYLNAHTLINPETGKTTPTI